MTLPREQVNTERYLFFTQDSKKKKKNGFVFQFSCLQPHLYIKIHAPRTHISTRKW